MVASAVILAGCGGGSKSSNGTPTGSTASTAALRRLEVTVVPNTTAALPRPTFLARLGEAMLAPRAAEAATGIAGCQVSASTKPGVTVTTDANGKALMNDVPVPAVINVTCPDGTAGTFNVNGLPGAEVTVKVRSRPGRLDVRSRHGDISPSISEPSVSKSDSTSSRRGPNSGSG